MVTVVDSAKFLDDFRSVDDLRDRSMALASDDERSISDLLADQIEFANVLVLNKTDLISEEELEKLEGILKQLNPGAKQIRSVRGVVPLEAILNTGLFDMEEAETSAGWVRELNGQHTPETLEYGIGSFVFQARRPFHPQRLEEITDKGFDSVLRAKGFLWLASAHDDLILFSIAGKTLTVEPQAKWLAAGDPAEEHDAETQEYMGRVWDAEYGDRRQEIVFIGIGMDQAVITNELHAALLTDQEMQAGPHVWVEYPDPFAQMFPERMETVEQ